LGLLIFLWIQHLKIEWKNMIVLKYIKAQEKWLMYFYFD